MDNTPSPESNNQSSVAPEPEELKPRVDNVAQTTTPTPTKDAKNNKKLKVRTYRPSHRATFVSLAIVLLILAINAGIIDFVLKKEAKENKPISTSQVTISPAALSKIGVNNSSIGNSGIELVVGPNAQFNGKVTVGGDVSIGGQLKLNSTFTANSANLTQLQAGNTSLSQLEVNGATTLSNLGIRNDLLVTGATQLQGDVTLSQLLTVNNGATITGNLAVGGTLSVNNFSANSLTSSSTLTIQGHVITGGLSPTVTPGGSALGSNGTVAIDGDDSAGDISINIGVNSTTSGTLAKVVFHTQFSNIPRVVISSIGVPGVFYVANLSTSGFDVDFYGGSSGTNGALPIGGFYINYIVEQ